MHLPEGERLSLVSRILDTMPVGDVTCSVDDPDLLDELERSFAKPEGAIPKEVEQAVLDEIVSRAGLAGKPRGEMHLSLLGAEYKVVVDERENFGESAFNLTLKKSSGGGKGSALGCSVCATLP